MTTRHPAPSASTTAARPDLSAIKAKQQATWSAGDTGWTCSGPSTGRCTRRSPPLDERQQAALASDLEQMLTRRNRSGDATLIYPGEYLEVVVTRA